MDILIIAVISSSSSSSASSSASSSTTSSTTSSPALSGGDARGGDRAESRDGHTAATGAKCNHTRAVCVVLNLNQKEQNKRWGMGTHSAGRTSERQNHTPKL